MKRTQLSREDIATGSALLAFIEQFSTGDIVEVSLSSFETLDGEERDRVLLASGMLIGAGVITKFVDLTESVEMVLRGISMLDDSHFGEASSGQPSPYSNGSGPRRQIDSTSH